MRHFFRQRRRLRLGIRIEESVGQGHGMQVLVHRRIQHEQYRHLAPLPRSQLQRSEAEAHDFPEKCARAGRSVTWHCLTLDCMVAVLAASYSTCTSWPGCTLILRCMVLNCHGSPSLVLASNSIVTQRLVSTWVFFTRLCSSPELIPVTSQILL